jgi:hypothetical protein
MKKLTECVAALKDVRRNMQNDADADPCIVSALDKAIAELERCEAEGNPTEPTVAQAAVEALAVISDILTCLTTVAELVRFFGA